MGTSTLLRVWFTLSATRGQIDLISNMSFSSIGCFSSSRSRVGGETRARKWYLFLIIVSHSEFGPIKALIHEKFGDGIMSMIDCKVSVDKKPDPKGDRVVLTFECVPHVSGSMLYTHPPPVGSSCHTCAGRWSLQAAQQNSSVPSSTKTCCTIECSLPQSD